MDISRRLLCVALLALHVCAATGAAADISGAAAQDADEKPVKMPSVPNMPPDVYEKATKAHERYQAGDLPPMSPEVLAAAEAAYERLRPALSIYDEGGTVGSDTKPEL